MTSKEHRLGLKQFPGGAMLYHFFSELYLQTEVPLAIPNMSPSNQIPLEDLPQQSNTCRSTHNGL